MRRGIAKIIRRYAATFAHVDPTAGRKMERIAKRQYSSANDSEKRSIVKMMERVISQREAAHGVRS